MDEYQLWLLEQKNAVQTPSSSPESVLSRFEGQIKDDRISCWWCHWWDAKANCNNRPYQKFAIANGTLQRCPGYKERSHLSLEDFGFCTFCGVAVATTASQYHENMLYCKKHLPCR